MAGESEPLLGSKPLGPLFWQSLPMKVALIGAYLVLNMTLNMTNKWVFSMYQFRFPLLLSMTHMGFSFVALGPIMAMAKYRDLHSATLSKQWLGLLGVGVFFATNLGFNNVSLLSMTLSLNQVIRATIPVITVVVAVVIEHRAPSQQEFLSLCVLSVGACMAVYEGTGRSSSVAGIVYCLLGTVSNGLMMSVIGRLVSEKLDVLRLTFYSAPVTCAVLAPFYLAREHTNFLEYIATHNTGYLWVLFLGSINALLYNMAHALVIKITSSVTTTVLGEMKVILLLILSSILLDEGKDWTPRMLVGCSLAVFGFCAYSHVRMLASVATPPLASSSQEGNGSNASPTRSNGAVKDG